MVWLLQHQELALYCFKKQHMKVQAEKTNNKKNLHSPGNIVQHKKMDGTLYPFVDNRPEKKKQSQILAMANHHASKQAILQKKENKTGLPNTLKSGIEALSGYSMEDVRVHYNSSKPAQLQAHAYAQGTDIHLASGQEKHLPHEAWHVVQQKQGRVKPTLQRKGKVDINDDTGLEREADIMGAKAAQLKTLESSSLTLSNQMFQNTTVQRAWIPTTEPNVEEWDAPFQGLTIFLNRSADKYFIRIKTPAEIPPERLVFVNDYKEKWLTRAQYDTVFSATAIGAHVIGGENQTETSYNRVKELRLVFNNNPTLINLDLLIKEIRACESAIEKYHKDFANNNFALLLASVKRVLTETVSKRALMVTQATTTGNQAVHGLNNQKMIVAQKAIEYSKSKITHGPQNQIWARNKHGNEGDINMAAMVKLTDAQWGAEGGYNQKWTSPRKIGAAVEATGGGNCQDIAALTYNFLREHCDPTWTVCFVVNNSVKHSFATIGNPLTDNPNDVVVADAWVQFPRAVTFQNHFCKNGTINVLRSKTGKKVGRTATLMSKYWDVAQLPAYVANLKANARTKPTNAATWNNNYPEGG